MRALTVFELAALSLLLVAPTAASSAFSEERGARFACVALDVHAVPKATARHGQMSASERAPRRARGRRFSARDLIDLELRVRLRRKDAASPIELRVYTPAGRLFQVVPMSVSINSSEDHGRRRRFRLRRGRTTFTARLPVAGTHITKRSMYGAWRAEVNFIGSESPCSRARTFVLER